VIRQAGLLRIHVGQDAKADRMDQTPKAEVFMPETFFIGRVRAQGILQDRTGRVRRRFAAEMSGRSEGDTLLLDEIFRFDDGEVSHRTWRLVPLGNGEYEGFADDVVGKATGRATASSFRLDYQMRLPIAGRNWTIRFADTMHRVGDRFIINRAALHLFGIRIADLTVAMQRISETDGDATERSAA
jgi:hypothetical protein